MLGGNSPHTSETKFVRRSRWFPAAKSRRSLLLLGTALVLLVTVGLLFWLNQPQVVSAQTVLSRAASPHLAPNQVAHLVYQMEQKNGENMTAAADIWLRSNAQEGFRQMAMDFGVYNADGSLRGNARVILDTENAEGYFHDVQDNTVQTFKEPATQLTGGSPNWFDGTSVAKYLEQVRQGNVDEVILLPPQTYNGVSVLAMEWKDRQEIFYFDSNSYILVGSESEGVQVLLTAQEILAKKDVPPDTFRLNLPPNARIMKDESN